MNVVIGRLKATDTSGDRKPRAGTPDLWRRQLCLQTGVQSKVARCFLNSAAGLLGGFAAALFLCNLAHLSLVTARDPMFAMPTSTLFWILGTAGVGVAIACVYMGNARVKLGLVLWFAATITIYWVGTRWQGVHGLGGYVAGLADAFNVSNWFAMAALNLLFSYLLTGSAAMLLRDCLALREEVQLKMSCPACGIHVVFDANDLWRKVPCPQCKTTVTLRKPELVKVVCSFCGGHIEFPSHAIGRQIRCPHCDRNITLKEPA